MALRRFHDAAVALPVNFWVPDLLEEYARIIAARGRRVPAEYAETRELAQRIVAALPVRRLRPCHNDLLAGNLLRELTADRIMIVDWEYAGMGHPCFDLGNLSVNNDFDEDAEERLLQAYHGDTSLERTAGDPEADAGALRRPRGGLGRDAGVRIGSRLRLRRLRRAAFRAAAGRDRRRSPRRLARSGGGLSDGAPPRAARAAPAW